MDQSTQIIHSLEAEHDRLNRKILFLERENRSLRKEVEEAQNREVSLLDEITRLEAELETRPERTLPRPAMAPAGSLEEFLNPTVGDGRGDRPAVGIEASWEPLMVAFTDEIFREANQPDLVLYLDEDRRAYVSPSGQIVLKCPITPEDLEKYNILEARRPTASETESIVKKYNL